MRPFWLQVLRAFCEKKGKILRESRCGLLATYMFYIEHGGIFDTMGLCLHCRLHS